MENKNKLSFLEKEIERLRKENADLKSEIKFLETELASEKARVDSYEANINDLQQKYEESERILSEGIESVYESQIVYKNLIEEITLLKNKYKKEAGDLITAIKYRTKKGV